jgi:hypothetical protein
MDHIHILQPMVHWLTDKVTGLVIYGRPLESKRFFDLRQGGFAVIYPAGTVRGNLVEPGKALV